MQHVVRVLRKVGSVFAWIIIALAAVMLLGFLLGLRFYVVETGSMMPTLPIGSVCVINQRADYDSVEENDIIVYQRDQGTRVIHRVAAVTGDGFETKGDANNLSDGISTTRENFVGRYLFHIPLFGVVIHVLQTLQGKLMAFALICVITALSLMLERENEYEEPKKQ